MFRKCSENVRKILSGEKYKYSKRVTQLFITLLERSSGQNFPEYFFRKYSSRSGWNIQATGALTLK